MLDPIRLLLTEASTARQARPFWQTAAGILGEWAGGARVQLVFTGPEESGTVVAGAERGGGSPLTVDWHDAEGRRVEATLEGAPALLPLADLRAAIEVASHLAVMVGRRSRLEQERRLGTFLVELSRWLLAAPEPELLLRYTLQSVMSLVEAHGAYVALHRPAEEGLRIVTTVGRSHELADSTLPLEGSITGRVVRSGQPMMTEDVRREPDYHEPPRSSDVARAAMIAPLNTSGGVIGAVAVIRYADSAAEVPAPFSLVELQYFTAVAAHIAGGLELSQAVAHARAAANRARAMVDGSPLPLALVDTDGHVHQLNEAACRVFGLAAEAEALGRLLDGLGLSPSELPLRLVLARAREAGPWHGRVLVTRSDGDRRICDCTVTGLTGLGSNDMLIALYDRTDELRAQRELIAREKLATVGEIASGVAHEVNNPLAAIRMEAELLGRASKDPDTGAAATTIVREVDRAARIVRSLLRLARRADTTPTRVQINDIVRDVAEIRQRVLRADNVEFRTQMDQAAPPVLGLGQELQQVVINLVTNAEHAVRGRSPAIIQLATHARQGWVRFTVEDSGPGVPHEVRTRIFDPFFTTKGPDEGSGLGLSICQRVVSEVGGKMWLEDSDELKGAKFVVELPAAPERLDLLS